MKLIGAICGLVVCSLESAWAGSDVLYMGRYYHDVSVEYVSGDKVKIHSKEGDVEIPWSALPASLQKANPRGGARKSAAQGRTSAQGFLPGQARLRGHILEKLPEGLLVDCPAPLVAGTAAPTEPTEYGIFLLKDHPMAAYLMESDPVNVIGTPAGTISRGSESIRVYTVAKADAR